MNARAVNDRLLFAAPSRLEHEVKPFKAAGLFVSTTLIDQPSSLSFEMLFVLIKRESSLRVTLH